MSTLIINSVDLASVADMVTATKAVEDAFLAYGHGNAEMPPKVYLDLPDIGGDFRAMPARAGEFSGLKWVNCHPSNPVRHGLPTVLGTYILSDSTTGMPLAILDGTLLTALRTGAAAGVASKYLAPPNTSTLGIIGCGAQAAHFIAAHRVFFPDIQVLCHDRNQEAAAKIAEECDGTVVGLEEAAGCDVVCTGTPSRQPFITPEMLKQAVHINAMGADAEGKQELCAEVLAKALVVIDDEAQAVHSGEVNVPIHDGTYSVSQIHGSLGEVVGRLKTGRSTTSPWTVFDSTGLAIQDLFLAKECYLAAKRLGRGQTVELV